MKTDTIAAVATALSGGGINIIRISGEDVFTVIDKLYESKTGKKKISNWKSHTIHYGFIKENEKIIDEVMILIMRAPHSYTTEDVVEIHCHGGVIVTKKIMELVIGSGARLAEPGEFTKRAFLNGRIDLSQAEAVTDLINAKNQYALQSSVNQLRGNILKKIKQIRECILRDVAFIEAALDDSEHIDMDGFSKILAYHIKESKTEIIDLLSRTDYGRFLTEGIKTVIVGRPNAGKSSLLNLLLGQDRAIVTEIAGTTRDILEETIQLNGIPINLIDTAGIRNTEDIVEKIGVEKARKYAKDADLILYIADASQPLDDSDKEIIEFIKDKETIVLLNKTDLDHVLSIDELEAITGNEVIAISVKEEMGLKELEQRIADKFFHGEIDYNDEVYITNIRHKEALEEAKADLDKVEESILNKMPEDFYTIDMMSAYEVLGKIIGESVDEDLINKIFSEFCMGK